MIHSQPLILFISLESVIIDKLESDSSCIVAHQSYFNLLLQLQSADEYIIVSKTNSVQYVLKIQFALILMPYSTCCCFSTFQTRLPVLTNS